MNISVITLFPELFEPVFNQSIPGRTLAADKAKINLVNLRDFGLGKHKTVDDRPYGGGVGMVLRVDVLDAAVKATRIEGKRELVVLLDPKGEVYSQEKAEQLLKYDHLILICGHYEGYDERIRELVDLEISIGDYILSGGEIGAIVVIDSLLRLIPGALKHKEATSHESFSQTEHGRILEAPQYTRPEDYKGQKVPEILLGGNHKQIEEYRQEKALKITKKRRPDLLNN